MAFAAGGMILVSDLNAFGNGGLIAVDPANGEQTEVVASTVFLRPFDIAVEADGQVLVAYLERAGELGTVMRVNVANGHMHTVVSGAPFAAPAGVAIEPAGGVVVADADSAGLGSHLFRIDLGVVGKPPLAEDKPPGAIYTGIAIEPTGHIVAAGNPNGPGKALLRFHPTDPHADVVTVSSRGKLVSPFGVAVEASGAILIVDRVNGVIRVNPSTGAQTTVSEGGSLVAPIGLAVKG